MSFTPDTLFLEAGAEVFPLAREVRNRLPGVPVRENVEPEELMGALKGNSRDLFGAGKKQLMLSRFKGSFLKKCPGISPGMVCCNYFVVNLIKNCIYDCTYCFLQDFLQNNPLLIAFVNVEDLLEELDDVFTTHPDRQFRVGTGEVTDSLALDDLLPYTDWLVPFFNDKKNAVLELKTKSDRIENLLKQTNPENVIVSWSLNPQEIIDLEEKGTPGLSRRLEAARQCREKGYRIGFHFDPIILYPGWERAYEELARQLFETIPPSSVEWISLGSFRYRPNLKQIIKERHPDTRLFTGEHVPGKDGKYRYLRPLRNKAYETVRGFLKGHARDLNIYLCMETKEIWEGVTGNLPRGDRNLDPFFKL